MYRHIGDVERIHTKFAARFGQDDELVLELKCELDRLNKLRSESAYSSIDHKAFANNAAPAKQKQYSQ